MVVVGVIGGYFSIVIRSIITAAGLVKKLLLAFEFNVTIWD